MYLKELRFLIKETQPKSIRSGTAGSTGMAGMTGTTGTKEEKKATEAILYVTDDSETAERLRLQGEAVLVYLHSGNS